MMIEMKHTPGPWHIAPRKPGNAYRITQSETPQTGALVIADLSCGAHRPDAEQAANARLITAAPAMLAALKEMQARYFIKFGNDDLYDKATAAIASAT